MLLYYIYSAKPLITRLDVINIWKNVRSPGIVNQTSRSIRSYIGDIFTPNPTFFLTRLTRKSWFTS